MIKRMERTMQDLLGASFSANDLVVVDHGNGFKSVEYRLSDEQLAQFRGAKAFEGLAAGHQITEPGSPTTLISTVFHSLCTATYNYWWVVLNTTANDMTKNTVVQVKGPGLNAKVTGDVTYVAASVATWFTTLEELGRVGRYLQKVKIAGSPVIKTKFWGAC